MKIKELKVKKSAELKKIILDLKKELFNLRFQKAAGNLKNTARVKQVRRTVARVRTLLNQEKKVTV